MNLSKRRLEEKLLFMEETIRNQDERVQELQAKLEEAQNGAEQISQIVDAILIAIVRDFGTDAPLGKRLVLPQIKTKETLKLWELHAARQGDGSIEMTIVDRGKMSELEEQME